MASESLAEEHLNQATDLISSTTTLAIFYTLTFILYCLSFRLSRAQLRDDHGRIKRRTMCTLVFQTVLLICATLDVIVTNRMIQVMYIDNSTLPGGPLGLPSQLSIATLAQIWYIVGLAENSLILGVLLWRIWVVWSGTCLAIPLTIASVFFYIGNLVSGALAYVISWNFDLTSLAATPQAESIINMTTLVFTLTSQVFMTSTIITRILLVRRKHIKLMGRSDVAGQYLSIAAMLIESYALDSLWIIGLIVSYSVDYAPTYNLFNNSGTQVNILTNFLLIYQVLSGRAWTRQTEEHLSSLSWASNAAGTTTSGTVELHLTSDLGEDAPVFSSRDGV